MLKKQAQSCYNDVQFSKATSVLLVIIFTAVTSFSCSIFFLGYSLQRILNSRMPKGMQWRFLCLTMFHLSCFSFYVQEPFKLWKTLKLVLRHEASLSNFNEANLFTIEYDHF